MHRILVAVFLLTLVPSAYGQKVETAQNAEALHIALEVLGDAEGGAVARITFRLAVPQDVPPGVPLVIQGSFLRDGKVHRNFRLAIPPEERQSATTIQTLPEGDVTVEARLMVPLEEQSPILVGKKSETFKVAKIGTVYVAGEGEGAEAVFAEGVMTELAGSVKIRPPRRDVAPNLFIVDVDVKPPVKRVEFWVEGKRLMARSAPPYRAELDLGKIPKRVEVRAVGYDAQGRYVDADAFVVNERETPLEVKVTRVVTPDNISHIKLSVQNPKNTEIRSVTLFAGQKKIHQWS